MRAPPPEVGVDDEREVPMWHTAKLVLITCRVTSAIAMSACGNSVADEVAVDRPASAAAPMEASSQLAALDTVDPSFPQAPATRNGNIWSGKPHQPNRADVESAEQNAGETTPRAEQHLDDKVDRIGRQLQQLEQRYPPGFLERE